MRGIPGIIIAVALVGGSTPAGADYLTEVFDQWHENTEAKPPKGLGPIKFDMTPAQVKRLCKDGWEPPKQADNLLRERTARCHGLPMNLGFEDYEVTFHFYQNRLVAVALMKSLADEPGPGPFTRARSTLGAKYGDVPDRTHDYRHSEDPSAQKIMDGWGSIYEWRFRRSEIGAEAVKIELVRFTLDGTPSMLLTYDSQRRQDRRDQLSQPQVRRAQSAY
jgi:hypothetical protein